MKITRRQLRRLIREACALEAGPASMEPEMNLAAGPVGSTPDVPVPEDYEKARSTMEQNPDLADIGINMVMDLAGTSCERSTAQAIIDHLHNMLYADEEQEGFSFTGDVAELPGDEAFGIGYEAGKMGLGESEY